MVYKNDPRGRDRRRAAQKGLREDPNEQVLVREYPGKEKWGWKFTLITFPPVNRTELPPSDMRRLQAAEQQEEEFDLDLLKNGSLAPSRSGEGEVLVLRDPEIEISGSNGRRRVRVCLGNGSAPTKQREPDRYRVSGGPAEFSRL